MNDLNERQQKFCLAAASGQSYREAAVAAGYAPRSAASAGSRLAARSKIARTIERLKRPSVSLEGSLAQRLASETALTIQVLGSNGELIGFFVPNRFDYAALAGKA